MTKENSYYVQRNKELQDALNITNEEKDEVTKNWQAVSGYNDRLIEEINELKKKDLSDLQNEVMIEKMTKEKA